MNIKDLKYLVALAEHGHFGKAAEACFVSQPALSMQIKKLENQLGVTLLERTNKMVLLTECGMAIAEQARQILTQVEEVREIAKSAKDPFSGELKIGIFPTLAPYLLPLIIPPLVKSFPNLSLYLVEEQTASLLEKLKQGKLHAAFLASPIPDMGLTQSLLFQEEFLLAVPHKHVLSERKNIKQQDLQHKELLLLDEGHCMRDQALTLCEKVSAQETRNFRATSLETLRHMVAAGVGITLMPQLACTASPHLRYIPFVSPQPMRAIGLYWRHSSSRQEVLREIAVNVRKIMSKHKQVKVY